MEENRLDKLREEYEKMKMPEDQVEKMKETIEKGKREMRQKRRISLIVKGAAATAAVFVILPNTSMDVAYAMSGIPVVGKLVEAVTFRDYQYEDERNSAKVEVPELVVREDTEENREEEKKEEGTEGIPAREETLEKTTAEINREIEEITDKIISEFEENLKYEEGYQSILVKNEIISTTDSYFTLKLICYQGSGSGAEWDYFYTIDLNTGERIALKDLFQEGADYITPISENIKEQMREQMKADENIMYWVDDKDVPEWNFKQITEETSFYINGENDVVIAFNEGDVAPMYMGCVEFVIPKDVLAEIRK